MVFHDKVIGRNFIHEKSDYGGLSLKEIRVILLF